MATFDKEQAGAKATELANTALAAGWLHGVQPSGFDKPEQAGKDAAELVAAFIRTLAANLQDL